MIEMQNYRLFAADCVRQAQDQETPEDKNLLLNVALAWLRLAQQTQAMELDESPAIQPEPQQASQADEVAS
jgi:hypothetical protein